MKPRFFHSRSPSNEQSISQKEYESKILAYAQAGEVTSTIHHSIKRIVFSISLD